tara:strand:+ start:11411 stop:13192 length:1782 start_codon:yes stop_codon:yes gene_type:complete
MGFSYIKDWLPIFIPLMNIIIGSISFFSLIGLGRFLMNIFKIKILEPWDLSCQIILGVFSLSLLNQTLAILRINTYYIYISVLFLLFLFGITEIKKLRFKRLNIERRKFIPLVILLIIFIVRVLLSIIPSTKIDELAYHMLIPMRIFEDQGLFYYNFPWEGAIWPHMHYQFIGPPFYSIGYPDSLNIITLGIFISIIYISAFLIFKKNRNIELSLWASVLISSGLYSAVDLTTNASNAFLMIASICSLLILCKPSDYIPSFELRSFSIYFSLLVLAICGSKISMVPIAIVLVMFYFKLVIDYWSFKELKKAILYISIPFLVFYLPLLIYTWIQSGSPFGPMLASVFSGKEAIYDPLLKSYSGELGYQGNLKEIIFFLLTKWSPLIWISWLIIPNKKINLRAKLTFLFIILIQFFIIWFILPDKPRHFGGFQYCALIICFIDIFPHFYYKLKNFLIIIFLFMSLPWVGLDIYYSFPLIYKAFFKTEIFKKDYIPFYEDFSKIDNLIEKDAQILVKGTRLNAFHSPRKLFMSELDIRDKKLPTYLFLVGINPNSLMKNFTLSPVLYQNSEASRYCYRTPGKSCLKDKVSLYKINF